MLRSRSAIGSSCAVIAMLPCIAMGAVGTLEEFTAGANGWIQSTTSSVVIHVPAGGNPGGFIEVRKDLAPPVFDIGARSTTADFAGNYAADGIVGASVDLNFMTANIDNAWIRFRDTVSTNGWRRSLTNVFPTNVWNTYAIAFDPAWSDAQALGAGWEQEAGAASFAAVMADVLYAEARVASDGSTLVGIDNFALIVPEPATLTLLGAGLLLARRRRMR